MYKYGAMIRVMQFADIINRNDFIDVIIQNADRAAFQLFACVRDLSSNIIAPEYSTAVQQLVLPGMNRAHIPLTAWRLAGLLRRLKIDILHAHHYDQAAIGWLATRWNPATKLIIGRHYSDAIYLLSRGLRKSLLLTLEERVNSAADCIIVPSKMISRLLAEQAVDARKVRVIPYAFPSDKWKEAESIDREALKASLGLRGLIFANFSRFHLEKGHTYLLQAIAKVRHRIRDLKVLLVGDGPLRSTIEEEIRRLEIGGCVQMLGWRKDALKIMAAVDVVLHPTLQEAFPQTMIEALYLRKPLVITPVSGAADVIADGVNGLMVPTRDPDAIAAAMQRLADDEPLRRRLGDAGHSYVADNLSVEKIIPQFENVYRTLAGPNPSC